MGQVDADRQAAEVKEHIGSRELRISFYPRTRSPVEGLENDAWLVL